MKTTDFFWDFLSTSFHFFLILYTYFNFIRYLLRFYFFLLNYELQVGRAMSLSFFFLSFVSCFRRISLVQKQKLKLMFDRHVYSWMCIKSSSHKYYYHDTKHCFRFPLLKYYWRTMSLSFQYLQKFTFVLWMWMLFIRNTWK